MAEHQGPSEALGRYRDRGVDVEQFAGQLKLTPDQRLELLEQMAQEMDLLRTDLRRARRASPRPAPPQTP